MLKSAKEAIENERLVKATVSELTFASMFAQLKKVMKDFDSRDNASASAVIKIKTEADVSFTETKREDGATDD